MRENKEKKVKVTKKVFKAANLIRLLWNSVHNEEDPWDNIHACQSYQDSLRCLKQAKLINDYNLDKIEQEIEG